MNKCPACLSNDTKLFLQLNARRLAAFCDYSKHYYNGLLESWLDDIQPVLFSCGNCGHIFYKNIPSTDLLCKMYASVKRSKSSPNPARFPSNEMLNEMMRLYKIMGKDRPTLLDYGSGYGRWSEAASKVGFQVISFEPHMNRSTTSCNYEILHDESQLDGLKFDVIWLEQVLEHIPEPLYTMQAIKKYMHAASVLRLSVPNIFRVKEKTNIWDEWPYNGKSSHILAPYQHLHGFSHSSLNKLVIKAGFKNYFTNKLIKYDAVHVTRIIFGENINRLSTTKRYLKL